MLNSKWAKLTFKIIAFSLIASLMLYGLGEFLYPPTNRAKVALADLRQAGTSENPPDTIIFGSSATFHGFIPVLYDEETGDNCLMAATAAQNIGEANAMLDYAISHGTVPKTVLLYLNVRSIKTSSSPWTVQTIENLPYGIDRLRLMTSGYYTLDDLPDLTIKAYRARERLPNKLKELYKALTTPPSEKKTQTSTEEEAEPDDLDLSGGVLDSESIVVPSRYLEKGFAPLYVHQNESSVSLTTRFSFSTNDIDQISLSYLNEIYSTCQNNGIELILYSMPRSPADILTTNLYTEGASYDDFHRYVSEWAQEHDLTYWDLNYLREDVLPVRASMFADGYHACVSLALPLSKVLGEMTNALHAGTFAENDWLVGTFEEYKEMHREIQSIYVPNKASSDSEGRPYLQIAVISGEDVDAEYRVSYSDKETGEYTLLQDWNQDKQTFLDTAPIKSGYYIRVEARLVGTDKILQTNTCKVSLS